MEKLSTNAGKCRIQKSEIPTVLVIVLKRMKRVFARKGCLLKTTPFDLKIRAGKFGRLLLHLKDFSRVNFVPYIIQETDNFSLLTDFTSSMFPDLSKMAAEPLQPYHIHST